MGKIINVLIAVLRLQHVHLTPLRGVSWFRCLSLLRLLRGSSCLGPNHNKGQISYSRPVVVKMDRQYADREQYHKCILGGYPDMFLEVSRLLCLGSRRGAPIVMISRDMCMRNILRGSLCGMAVNLILWLSIDKLGFCQLARRRRKNLRKRSSRRMTSRSFKRRRR